MGWFSSLHARRGTWSGPISSKDPALAKIFGSGWEASAGTRVTPENAFTFSAVFDAVNQISSDVAKLPLVLRKRRPDGGSDPLVRDRVFTLLKHSPNDEQGSMVFRRTLVSHALTGHGGFAEIERDNFGRPAALWNITPDRIEPIRRTKDGPLEYLVDGATIMPAQDVIHIHGLGYDGINGHSVIAKARQTIGLALAMEKFGAQYFGKGTIFGGWLETDEDLDADQKKDIKEWIEAFRNSQDTAFKILVTEGGRKFHQFSNKPSESQMDESRIRQVEEVARFFRMPPHRLGVNTPGTVSYASVEAANTDYYTGALLDWMTLIEQEFERKLIPRSAWGEVFIKHTANAFLRGDTTARSAFYSAMLDRGVFNADDVLELEDMNPQPDGIGKMFLVQGAQVSKSQIEDLVRARIERDREPAMPADRLIIRMDSPAPALQAHPNVCSRCWQPATFTEYPTGTKYCDSHKP